MSMEKDINIAIVEDDILTRVTLKKMLNPGLICTDFDNAQDCIKYIQNNKIDLIVMDNYLPDMSGIKASDIIKSICPKIKIAILSPYTTDEEVIKILSAKADAYIIKDLKQKGFNKVINSVINGQGGVDLRIQHSLFNYFRTLPKNELISLSEELTHLESHFIKLVLNGTPKSKIVEVLNIQTENFYTYCYSIINKFKQLGVFKAFGGSI